LRVGPAIDPPDVIEHTALPGAILASETFATLALQRLRTRFRFAGLCVSFVHTLPPSAFAKYRQMRSAMRHWLRRCAAIAAFALVLASLPLTDLAAPPLSRADDGCGDGMYYNYETLDCEPWVQVGVYVDPYIPVPIPNWNPIDINADIDVNPGGPGGIGRPGGPGGPGGINPGRPGGGGRGGGGRGGGGRR
jgi:hypothetical protein